MKNIYIIISILSFSISYSQAQDITCSELLEFVQENGYKKGEVSALSLFDTSWLKSVEAYQCKNTIFVVAEMVTDSYGIATKKYIYCGIPLRNWENFSNGLSDFDLSYGEKFHKYIIDYKCNCN